MKRSKTGLKALVLLLVLTTSVYGRRPLPRPFRRALPAPHRSVVVTQKPQPVIEEVPYNPDATDYTTGGITVDVRGMAHEGHLDRHDGPTYNWPGCGHHWCMMCVGIHMRSSAHGEDYQYLNEIGSAQWLVLHDNAHNSREADHTHSIYSEVVKPTRTVSAVATPRGAVATSSSGTTRSTSRSTRGGVGRRRR